MPPLEIEFTSRFRAEARALPTERQTLIEQALASFTDAFGSRTYTADWGCVV